ncbi:acyl-CoA reductase [Sporosarcina sp. FSL K6-3457]|uniref:acyl-CoA reductase n=1 Tax=Sporosarcina sp. FSL K6-3457 TaxID=2978204 RepID=UPI0030F956F0
MRVFWPKSQNWREVIFDLRKQETLTPFHPEVLSFVQALSMRLVRMRAYPEVVALGYWLRRAHIHEMKEAWLEETKNRFVKSRGTVFHLAPSNVDTIFIYSWMLSLLAGNRNIIRVSGKEQLQTNALLSVIIDVLQEAEHTTIAERTIVLTYDHSEQVTAFLSSECHTRVVWGGDETVNAIRRIQLAPIANELVFPDRFSLAVLNAEAVLHAKSEEKEQLLQRFYNDSFWFDQMACSSPRLIVWTGSNEVIEAVQIEFWSLFDQVIRAKEAELMSAIQVQKFATGLALAAEVETKEFKHGTTFSRVSFERVPANVRERHCGGGLFFECKATELAGVSTMIVDKDQTVSYFGFSKEELGAFVEQVPTRGIDRIVPVGQALDFDGVWDGQSFLKSFTREVVIL